MICPYNGFKEMNCEKCGAHMLLYDVDEGKNVYVCALARNGCQLPDRPIIAWQGDRYEKLI